MYKKYISNACSLRVLAFVVFFMTFSFNPVLATENPKTETWICKADLFAGISYDANMKGTQSSSQAGKGHIHIFEGIGKESLALTWADDSPGTPPDVFQLLNKDGDVLTYYRGGGAGFVMWRFFQGQKIAMKYLGASLAGIVASLQSYRCGDTKAK